MSRISPVAPSNPSSSNSSAVHSLKDVDVDQFLQLMITELTNQDPLNPMDNAQLVEQVGQLRSIAASDQLSSTNLSRSNHFARIAATARNQKPFQQPEAPGTAKEDSTSSFK